VAERDPKVLPDEQAIFKLASNKSPSDLTLRSSEWAVITQVDGQRSIVEIAEVLAMASDEAVTLFNGLFQKGLIEVVSVNKNEVKNVPISFFDTLDMELTKIIGPVAPFLIDDTLWDMEIKKNEFNVNRVPELIEAISDEITDESKKVAFQQIMLNLMKGLEA
jgi:hypothetical protein